MTRSPAGPVLYAIAAGLDFFTPIFYFEFKFGFEKYFLTFFLYLL